jgi:hypothetical protein
VNHCNAESFGQTKPVLTQAGHDLMDRIAEIEQKLEDAEALVHEKKLAEERLKVKKAKQKEKGSETETKKEKLKSK